MVDVSDLREIDLYSFQGLLKEVRTRFMMFTFLRLFVKLSSYQSLTLPYFVTFCRMRERKNMGNRMRLGRQTL